MPKAATKKSHSKGVRVAAPTHHALDSGAESFQTIKDKKLGMKALQEERKKVGPRYSQLKNSTDELLVYALQSLRNFSEGHRIVKDTRTWSSRIKNFDENWKPRLPLLVEAYLRYRYASPPPDRSASDIPEPSPSPITIDVLDIYTCQSTASIPVSEGGTFAEDLVAAGYLGTTPVSPSLAISLKTLELFRCIRLFKPSFSTEAFTKLLCHQYYIPYRRYYRTLLADAFDIYLTILDLVEKRVMERLGRDVPDWRAQNSCPCCSYELEGEEPGAHWRMICIDGNNSLKRLATSQGRQTGDMRTFESDYFLPRAFVDTFANEVKARQRQSKPDLPVESEDDDVDQGPRTREGFPTDGASDEVSAPCASNWKAAAADEVKKMWGMFDETGIFLCACRHAMVLWVADMVRSGELAKYALAMTSRVNEKIKGKKMFGYDIGCAFEDTVLHSILRDLFLASGSRFCVPAFHGYSHSYRCQCHYHPNAIQGVGLEDFETAERIFARSNELASVVRGASVYRRHLFIDMFFRQHDRDRYANMAQMLHGNYVQALEVIETQAEPVAAMLENLGLTREKLADLAKEEKTCFTTLKDEDPTNVHTVAYVEALQALQKAKDELLEVSERFRRRAPREDGVVQLTFLAPRSGPVGYDSDLSETRKLETRRRHLHDRVDRLSAEVASIEADYNIETRWQPTDFLYRQTVDYIATRQYQRALGKLQRLVILRLFELQKLNIARTGYKVRTYLAKSLQRRCKAIRRAVEEYNVAARELQPPRPTVDWDKVSHYSFIEEFSLLQDTRNDIRSKPWASSDIREAMRLSRRIDRAYEEITNCNREIRRLHMAIRDEEILFRNTLRQLREDGDPAHGAVEEYCKHRRAANARNMAYIERIYALKGFTGIPSPGCRLGAPEPNDDVGVSGEGETDGVSQELEEEAEERLEDGASSEVFAIVEYLARLTT
ncbi:hypothetical protein OH76DRAFT_1455223 [Lentinus brumalis]|uniref:CxC1-like cysteine cluster associated with KDZ transposases domain-containing protein n=1 Tax=Lentinus brumalis TaxID=2498619 RepID=A0A371DDY2_9APHY|nr:hypothetical protein OH76DRAFT_1455223 [Polyporus brumalis]